jgi:hypothetical protein
VREKHGGEKKHDEEKHGFEEMHGGEKKPDEEKPEKRVEERWDEWDGGEAWGQRQWDDGPPYSDVNKATSAYLILLLLLPLLLSMLLMLLLQLQLPLLPPSAEAPSDGRDEECPAVPRWQDLGVHSTDEQLKEWLRVARPEDWAEVMNHFYARSFAGEAEAEKKKTQPLKSPLQIFVARQKKHRARREAREDAARVGELKKKKRSRPTTTNTMMEKMIRSWKRSWPTTTNTMEKMIRSWKRSRPTTTNTMEKLIRSWVAAKQKDFEALEAFYGEELDEVEGCEKLDEVEGGKRKNTKDMRRSVAMTIP